MSDSERDLCSSRVIHPLDDQPEQKLYHPAQGRMVLTRTVRLSLWALRGYLGLMVLLVAWRLTFG